MSAPGRQLSVYDGTRCIGIVIERGDKSCIAKDVNGRKLGRFATVKQAADAVTEIDKVFNARGMRSG